MIIYFADRVMIIFRNEMEIPIGWDSGHSFHLCCFCGDFCANLSQYIDKPELFTEQYLN